MVPTLTGKLKAAQDALYSAGAQHAVMRLQTAAQHVDELPFDALYRLIDPERAIDELEQAQARRARSLSLLRNIFALAPLILTWGALALATIAYQRELAANANNPDIYTKPFLDLWETGFNGVTPFTFSLTAGTDCVLLACVVILTFLTHRAEVQAARRTQAISAQLDDLLEQLAVVVNQRIHLAPNAQPRDWVEAVQQVIQQATKETARLMQANQDVVAEAQKAMQKVSDDTKTFVTTATSRSEQVLQGLYASNEQLIQAQMGPIVAQLGATVGQLHAELTGYHQSTMGLAQVIGQLGGAANTLAGSASTYTQIAASTDQHLQRIDATLGHFVQLVQGAAASMKQSADAVQQLVMQINTGMVGNLEAASRALGHTEIQLGQTAAALNHAATRLDQAARIRNGVMGWVFAGSGQQPPPQQIP